jgi:hypothetical protein
LGEIAADPGELTVRGLVPSRTGESIDARLANEEIRGYPRMNRIFVLLNMAR